MPRPYAYHEIRDVYELLKSQGAVTESLPEWAQSQNAATGSHAFDTGINEGYVIKPLMYHLRNLVGATGIPDVTAGVGELAGGLIGEPEMGRQVGEGAGYGVANLLPMAIPGLGPVAMGTALGGLAAANTYADTNSTGAAIASGFTAGLMPGVSNAVEQFALKRMGGEAVSGLISTNPAFLAGTSPFVSAETKTINRMFAKNLTQGAGAFVAGQGAGAVLGEAGRFAESQLDPNADPYDFNLKRMALEMTVGQLPFAAMYATKGGREQFGGDATREAVASLRANMAKTEKAAGEYAARMEREAGNSLTTKLPDLNQPLDDEQSARVKAVLQPEQPVDLNLVGKLEAFKKAEAEGITGNEELGRMKAELDTELAGNEHRLFNLSSVPTEKIEGIVHWGGAADSNRSRTIELTAPALGYEAGTLLQFPVDSSAPLAKRGETQVFDVPVAHSRAVQDAFPEKTAQWKANREKPVFDKKAYDEQNPLLIDQQTELGHQKWLEERAAERERQRTVLAEAEKRTADLWTLAKDVTRPGVDLADTLNKINEVHRELGMPDVSQAQVKEISKQLTYGKNGLVDLVEAAKAKIEVKKEVIDRVEKNQKEREDFRAQAAERLRLLDDMRLETDGDGRPTRSAMQAQAYMDQFNSKLKTHKDGAYRDFVAWHDGGYQGDFSPKAMRDNVTGLKDQSGLVKVAFEQGVPEKVSETPTPDEQVIKNEGDKLAERVKEMGREEQEANEIDNAAFDEDWIAFTKELQKYPNPRELITKMDKELLATPYVMEWVKAYAKEATEFQPKASFGPPRAPQRVDAGDNFIWDFVGYDPALRKLGKHTLPKDGMLTVAQFKNMAGEPVLSNAVLELGRLVVPEAFEGDRVNVPKLYEGLKEKGPVVEVKKLGGEKTSGVKAEFARLIHEWYDTLTTNQKFAVEDYQQADNPKGREYALERAVERGLEKDKVVRFSELSENLNRELPDSTSRSRYAFLGPKSEQDMPGYVEGLVRVPMNEKLRSAQALKAQGAGRVAGDKVLYNGPHFGSEDTNVLAFFRGYEETLPDGRKAFHVIEVQSDWGQEAKKWKDNAGQNLLAKTKSEKDGHPLLSVYEPLALKAAVEHARSVGADVIILSDAETAMMTEGHDKQVQIPGVGYPVTPEEARRAGHDTTSLKPVQNAGMRLHYDTTLPSAMKRLAGVEGVPVELPGVHKMATSQSFSGLNESTRSADKLGDWVIEMDSVEGPGRSRRKYPSEEAARKSIAYYKEFNPVVRQITEADLTPVGSPVFRNPDGTPKSNITGRLYDLTAVNQKLDARGGKFTLTNPSWTPPTPFIPTSPKDIKKVADIGKTPLENLDYVIRNTKDPVTKALAVHFSQFKATLARSVTEWISNDSRATHSANSREGRILYGEEILTSSDHLTEFTIMHEVAHQLTLSELDNPTNAGISKGLDEMRVRMIEKLPPEIRARVKELQEKKWMERYTDGQRVEVLHKEQRWADIIYGMLNTKEFVSQGMSSKFMRGWLLEQKAQGGSWFNKFKLYVKQLLRFNWDPKDTAYDEFLHRTSELMEFSNHAADFHTFADQFLKAKGVLDDVWRNQQVRDAHGIIMKSVAEDFTGRTLLDNLNTFRIQDKVERQGSLSPEVVKAARQLQQTLKARGTEWQEIVDTATEFGFAPTLGGIHDFFDQSLMGASNLEWKLDTLPTAMKKYLGEQVKSMDGILSVLDGAVRQGNKGLVNLTDPKVLEKPVRDAIRILQTFKDMQTNHEAGLNLAQTLSDVANPVNWIAAAGAPPQTKQQQVAHETIWGRSGKAIADFMEQGSQLARRSPLFAEWFAKAGLLSNTISRKVDDTVSILHREIGPDGRMGDLSAAQQAKIDRIISSPRMLEATRRWFGESNQQGGAATKLLPQDDPSIAREMGALTAEERVLVKEYADRLVMQKIHRDEQRFQTQREEAASVGSRLIIRSMGVKPDIATDAMHQVLDGVEAVLDGDQVGGMAKLSAIQAKLTPDAYVDAVEYAKQSIGLLNADKDYARANPAWISAQRGGAFLFSIIVDGEPTKLSADTAQEARHLATKLTGKPDYFDWKANDRAHLPEQGPNDVERLKRLTEMRDYQRNWLQEKGIDVSVLAEYDKLDVVRQSEREYAAAHNLQTAKPILGLRGLKKGAKHLPWLMNQSKWHEKDTAYWERRLLAIQRDTMLMSPDYVNNPEVSAKVKQHSEALLSHDPELIRGIQKFVVTWGLTGNIASWMANGSQTIMRTFPELIRASGSPWQAAKEIATAWIDYGKHKTGRQDWNGPEENRFYAEAYRDGKISQSQFDEVGAKQVDANKKYQEKIQGDYPRTKVERTISAADAAGQWGMKLFKMGERANATVTLMATFRMLRKQGMEYNEAKRQAYEIHASSNDVGGRANRSIGMFDNKDKFSRGTAMLASTLQGYSIGSVTQLLRHINEGWGKGMTPAESYKAKKAAIAMATVQFTAAGMIGMPFVASILSLLDKYVPELEANKKVRESVSWAFGDEGDQPGTLSQAFMMGLPSMLGWDMQSRLSSGNILPGVSEYNGFQPGNLLGAPINTATQFAKGASKLLSGDTSGGLAFLPPALRKLGELWKEDGMIQDFKGRPVLNDLTGGEKVGIALGFQPKRLTDFNTAQRIAELGETNARRSKAQERQSWAQDVLKGNFGSVRAKMEQKANLDPNFDWKQEVRAIANEAEDLTFARDLRREGIQADSTQRSQLLRSFGLATGQADEKTRILFRQRIEQRFGLRGNKVRELRLAEEMDKIDRQSPGLSRVERRRIAEQSLRPYWRQSAQPQIDE